MQNYMIGLEELGKVIKDFCNNQITIGKTKSLEDLSFPCIPIAKIPPYLRSKGINWREYGYGKLPDLINKIGGLGLVNKGVPYVYLQPGENNLKEANDKAVPICSVEQCVKEDPKEHEIRGAYRNLMTKPEDWVPIDSLMKEVKWHGTPEAFTGKYNELLQIKSERNLVRVHNISKYEIVDDIYFGPNNGYTSNVEKLREMALDENWDDNDKRNKLLDFYLRYTYAKVKNEDKIAMSEDKLHACWNTGLVDFRYKSIFCYMTRKNVNKRWVFKAFCIDGENQGKYMVSNISKMPESAVYFTDSSSLLCQPTSDCLSVDYDHMFDHPSRLPKDWLKQILAEDAEWKEDENPKDYDKRISSLLLKKRSHIEYLQKSLEQAIEKSLKRCQWNYKTAIPYYNPNCNSISQSIGWFLPLCVEKNEEIGGKEKRTLIPFAALVVTKKKSGRFQGETIYQLSWAYRCARLVCRPDSDWLTPSFFTDKEMDTDTDD